MYNKKGEMTKSSISVEEIDKLPIKSISDRGISLETAQRYGVRTAVSEHDGKTPTHHYYPYTKNGERCGYKARALDRKRFFSCGVVDYHCDLFGMETCGGGRKVFVTEGECFPNDSEVLTSEGWKKFEDINGSEKVAQWHVDHTITWTNPLQIVKKKWSGNLLQYTNNGYVSRTTPLHKLVSIGHRGEIYTHTADEGPTSYAHHVPRGGLLFGSGISLKNEQIALCLAVCADATIDFRKSGERYARFGLKKNRKIERLTDILDSLRICYSCNEISNEYTSICFTLPKFVPGKTFDWSWIETASVYQRDFILNELTFWDGNLVPNRNQTEFTTKHKHLADWVQAMAHTFGYCSSIIERKNRFGEWYKVSILRGKKYTSWQAMRNRKEYIPYEGYVYCVTVPSGHVVVRQDDKVTVSGNCDAMRLYEVLSQKAQEQGYGSRKPNVVSIGGAGWAVDHLANNKDFLNKFAEVVLVFDQDEAGFEAVKRVSHLFPYVKYATFSRNDVCDMKGREDELYKAVLFESKQYRPSGIIQGSEITLEKLQEPKPQGLSLPYPKLNRMLRGLRPGEITTVTSGSGCGKTTFISEIEYHLNKYHEQKVAAIYLESGHEESARRQIALDNNVTADELAENPSLIPKEAYEQSYRNLIANGRWLAIDHWGSLASDELIYKIRHLATVEDVKFIFLDHISIIVSGQDINDERKAIDLLMSKLASLVVELQIHIINVVHLTRRANKDYYTGALPSLGDLRGSGGLEQLSWQVIALSRDQSAENPDLVDVWVLKNRTARRLGKADSLMYDQQTGRLKPLAEEF